MRITYIGHATLFLETRSARILFDPLLRPRLSILCQSRFPRQQVNELLGRKIDLAVISHLHADHADKPSLQLLQSMGVKIALPQLLGKRPIQDYFAELHHGQSLQFGDIKITALPAQHDTALVYEYPSVPNAYLITAEDGTTFYYAGDTEMHDDLPSPAKYGKAIVGECRKIDIAAVPLGGWAPNLGPGHMNHYQAAEAVSHICPRVAMPIHWDSLHLPGIGRWWERRARRHFEAFEQRLEKIAPTTLVHRVHQGQTCDFAELLNCDKH